MTRFYGKALGGIEKTIEQIILNSDNDTTHWIIATNKHNNYCEKKFIEKKKYFVINFKETFFLKGIVVSINLLRNYKIIYNNSDVIHFHCPWPLLDFIFLYNFYLKGLESKKILVSYHAYITKFKYLDKFYNSFQKLFFNKINFFHFSTPNYFNIVNKKLKIKKDKKIFFVSPNILITKNKIKNQRTNNNIKLNDKTYLFIGRKRHYKGFYYLAEIIKKNPEKKFLAITDYKEFKKDYNINSNNLKILSNISENNKKYILKNSYALLFTSNDLSESFGLVLLEAIYYGLPVIAFKCKAGHNYFVKDGYNSLLAKDTNSSHMSYLINKLHKSKQLRNMLSKKCKQTYFDKFRDLNGFNKLYSYIYNHQFRIMDK